MRWDAGTDQRTGPDEFDAPHHILAFAGKEPKKLIQVFRQPGAIDPKFLKAIYQLDD